MMRIHESLTLMLRPGNKFCFVLLVLIGFCILPTAAQDKGIKFSADPNERFQASTIKWREHFGYRAGEPNNTYCLMTQGAFRAPKSKEFDSLVKSWFLKHPNAQALVVYTISPMLSAVPDSKMKSVWIVDGEENLNIYVVRMGGCPPGTMVLNPGDQTPLEKNEYEAFAKRVWEAGDLAKKEKLGIWAEGN